MNTEQTLPPAPANPPPEKSRRRHLPHLLNWVVGIVVLFIVAGLAVPNYNHGCSVSPRVRGMAQAKQIGLALKLFASDHEGVYPRSGLPDMLGAEIKNSNAAFAVLFPVYLKNEMIFGNKLSAYQTRQPDNQIDDPYTGKPVKTLEPGENVYAYVAGLNDEDQPLAPLVIDGTDGTGHYTTDPKKRGGVWEGKQAIVVHPDNSAALETLAGPDHARYIPRHDEGVKEDKGNLLDVSGLGPEARLLDPAVPPPDKP